MRAQEFAPGSVLCYRGKIYEVLAHCDNIVHVQSLKAASDCRGLAANVEVTHPWTILFTGGGPHDGFEGYVDPEFDTGEPYVDKLGHTYSLAYVSVENLRVVFTYKGFSTPPPKRRPK